MDVEEFKCPDCTSSFYRKRYLAAHRVRVHGRGERRSAKERNIICLYCGKAFASEQNQNAHTIRAHGLSNRKHNIKCHEANCAQSFYRLGDLRKHLSVAHGFESIDDREVLTFTSKADFDRWLETEEQHTKTHFVLQRGKMTFTSHSRIDLMCSRSGQYHPVGTGKRQPRTQGTKKIGYHCTAQMIVKLYPDGNVEVTYYRHHYKHDFQLQHVPLPASIRESITEKVLSGVDKTTILRDIRGDLVTENVEMRHHIITRKDISNIVSSIGVQLPSQKSSENEMNLRSWVEDMKSNGNVILSYKEPNTLHHDLDDDEFFLAFMTPVQKKMFSDFASDRVCIDSNYGVTDYGFELVTVLVVNRHDESFPVAFCLTSTVNYKTMEHFFRCIKSEMSDLQAKVFISDDPTFFYYAWENTFGPVDVHLLCTWHIEKLWHGHLESLPRDKRDQYFKVLKKLLSESDINAFQSAYARFLEELSSDPDGTNFLSYFQSFYANRVEMWARCYRNNKELDHNLEKVHYEVKHKYLLGKRKKTAAKCCEELVKYVFEKAVKLHNRQSTNCIGNHKRGIELSLECTRLSENVWMVGTHTVTCNHDCDGTCSIVCRDCNCCAKAYTCTCRAPRITCKHIHAAISARRNKTVDSPSTSKNNCDNHSTYASPKTTKPKVVARTRFFKKFDLYKDRQ